PGPALGAESGEPHRQVRKAPVPEGVLERAAEASPADQAGASESEVEIAEHAPAGQLAAPLLEGIEFPGGKQARDDGPDRGARNNLGTDAVGNQGGQHAHMSEPAGGAAAQYEADREPIFRMRSGTGKFAGQLLSQHVQIWGSL